jgi:hypothetical protein
MFAYLAMGDTMRTITKAVLFLGILTLGAGAADERNSVVVTFKDGHKQSFPLSDVSRLEIKNSGATTNVRLPIGSADDTGHFLGRWRVGDGQGHNFTITLNRNGSAAKSIGSTRGTWKVENSEARISWDDGWHDTIRRAGNTYEKVARGPGKNFTDDADNVTEAKSLDPI